MLSQEQQKMLSAIEEYCQQNNTTAWVGNQQGLNEIGGQQRLYELEQAGVVSINRMYEKWIVCPSRREN